MESHRTTHIPQRLVVMLSCAVSCALVFLCAPKVVRGNSTPPLSARDQVLVLAPSLLNPDIEHAWLAPGIQQSLAGDLSRRLSSRVEVSGKSAAGQNEAIELAKTAGAQQVITAAIQLIGDQIRVTGLIIDVKSGVTLSSLKATGRLNDLFEMEDLLSDQACRALIVHPATPAGQPITIAATGPLRINADASASEGLEYAQPYAGGRFQNEQNRYIYSGYPCCYGYCYWGYPGWGFCWGGHYSPYPTPCAWTGW